MRFSSEQSKPELSNGGGVETNQSPGQCQSLQGQRVRVKELHCGHDAAVGIGAEYIDPDRLPVQNSTHLDWSDEKHSPLGNGNCSGGIAYFGYCYKFVSEKKTWIEAELHCRDLAVGGHLASLHWMEQMNILAEMVHKSQHRYPETWIGLSDIHKEGTFLWSDGSASDFMFWAKGEPNDHSSREECVHAFLSNSLPWNDAFCNVKFSFLCSYKLPCPCSP
ncbi:C-type lectin-like [Stegostoma tigrinum]|uniref:C-type lectin-like n=1 Tax=Stegostoma tigrinum TaxID=3053191 RepID=UPI0028708110|nr:C-type lectin-like [Stegostoma tigrinum]